MPTLLIIDDEASIRLSIQAVFAREDVTVLGAETAEEGLRLTSERSPEVILLDIKLGSRSGLDVFHQLRHIDHRVLIVFITGFGTTDTAIEAMKLGAYDYLTKPLDAKQLKQVVGQALAISRLAHVPTILDEGDRPEDRPDRLIGSGPAMQAVCKQIGRVAPQDLNVLILGESGTGKGSLPVPCITTAVATGLRSWRSTAPLFPSRSWRVNCSGMNGAHLRAPTGGALGSSNNVTAARFSWMKWATWPRTHRPRFSA
jgi:DNA-binding NtrC family response regulator